MIDENAKNELGVSCLRCDSIWRPSYDMIPTGPDGGSAHTSLVCSVQLTEAKLQPLINVVALSWLKQTLDEADERVRPW